MCSSDLIHQDAFLYVTRLENKTSLTHPLAPGRKAYIHVARGEATVNGQVLTAGDGVKIEKKNQVTLSTSGAGEALLFDLP